MEGLTKTQLILLALLVSFVTSIATGIVTVTLLDQAPPGVTQTINRVVERTVERVVPGQAASVITKETTVVVKEENLIIDAVEKNSRSVVRIGLADEKNEFAKTLGVGLVFSSDGRIVTDSLNLNESKSYLIKTQSGRIHQANLVYVDLQRSLAVLDVVKPKEDEKTELKFIKPSFGKGGDLKLGQTVIAIGGLLENSVSTGIISKLNKKTVSTPNETAPKEADGKTPTTEIKVLDSIESSLALTPDYSGGPMIDVDGFVLAINMKRKEGDFSVPIDLVLDIFSNISDNATTTAKQ